MVPLLLVGLLKLLKPFGGFWEGGLGSVRGPCYPWPGKASSEGPLDPRGPWPGLGPEGSWPLAARKPLGGGALGQDSRPLARGARGALGLGRPWFGGPIWPAGGLGPLGPGGPWGGGGPSGGPAKGRPLARGPLARGPWPWGPWRPLVWGALFLARPLGRVLGPGALGPGALSPGGPLAGGPLGPLARGRESPKTRN